MGVIKTTQNLSIDLTTITAEGDITIDIIIKWIKEFYSGPITNLQLWDCTEADITGITKGECKHILLEIKAKSYLRTDGKTALIFNGDLMFGLGRMFESYSEIEHIPIHYRSFRDKAEAKKWLGV